MATDNQNFFERVYAVAKQIPYGKVTSYGAIAKYLGAARSARMVGWAMNASHLKDEIPAHRVVNRKGLLTGKHHFDGTNLMQQLLENEGVVVIDSQIQNLEDYFWDPIKELE
ncbi:MGMT family protein [Cellulophaga omnivescoria]|uniref:MGMT family protein n=1 Tax=Cellulophaga omnivescoria TaxID=1888890 RepID=UPI0009861438|nr:MGMT family protein [Cellulophaga omnivescoria]WBU90253.1 MGMT family protein [Cellulophaga omnivescoria]